MTEKQILQPSAEHPITITPTAGRVTVRVGERTIVDTTSALTLQESTYPAVQYVPLADVDPGVLVASTHATYCPFKGDAGYFSVATGEQTLDDAVWFYAEPYDAVAEIKDHVAFYTDRVELTVS